MHDAESGGSGALLPRPLTPEERNAALRRIAAELPRLQRILSSVADAAADSDAEAALVALGILTARSAAVVFPP